MRKIVTGDLRWKDVAIAAAAVCMLNFCNVMWAAEPNPVAPSQPNFVLILVDDLGYADLSCFGASTIQTPQLDRMAAEGVKLTSFYAAAPICTPTRAALMTGCYATRVGLPTPLHVYDDIGLNDAELTLPEVLQQAGYHTACIGKWHLGHSSRFYPTEHGFDRYWGTPLGHMFNRPAVGKAIGDTSDLFLDNTVEIPFPEDADLTERLTEQAVRFLEQKHDRPFFLFLSHPMPHEPLAVSERFAGQSAGGLYGDVVECLDWSVGQILETLEAEGLTESTVVVFTSDNGPKKGHGSAKPLRGFKHDPYEGGVRVPCLVRAPGMLPAGSTTAAIATVMDLYPTFVKLAGGSYSDEQVRDGVDLWPLLRGTTPDGPHTEFFYFVRHGVLAGMRRGDWKLLEQKGETELYNLTSDVGEQRNLASQQTDLVAELKAAMRAFEAEVRATQRPAGMLKE